MCVCGEGNCQVTAWKSEVDELMESSCEVVKIWLNLWWKAVLFFFFAARAVAADGFLRGFVDGRLNGCD